MIAAKLSLKPIPTVEAPKLPVALAPTVKLGGKKIIVDEIAAKAAKKEKEKAEKEKITIKKEEVKPIEQEKEEKKDDIYLEREKVDETSIFQKENPFKEINFNIKKEKKLIEKPFFKGVRKFNSSENLFTATPIIVTKTFNNFIKTNEVKTKSFDSLIAEHTESEVKMPRPQLLQIVDSKKNVCQVSPRQITENESGRPHPTEHFVKEEFKHKVDSVRTYWSKVLDNLNANEQDGKMQQNDEHTSRTNLKNEEKTREIVRKRFTTYEQDDQNCAPTVEIIELDGQKQAALVKPKNSNDIDFDHVRYKVMKSDMFQKNLLVNHHRKEAQFDGLMQYLQDYSFQELLANNNVVIIEPVRTKIEKISDGVSSRHQHSIACKITNGAQHPNQSPNKKGLKKHFFYHPIRVNKELLDEELPSPDTVRNVRKMFEGSLRFGTAKKDQTTTECEAVKVNTNNKDNLRKKALRYLTIDTSYGNPSGIRKWDSASLSSGVSSGDLSSPCECGEESLNSKTIYSSEENLCGDDDDLENHYVSQDVLEKIRECGSTVTYFGGRMTGDKRGEHVSQMTKAIMREIRGQEKKCGVCQPFNCKIDDRSSKIDGLGNFHDFTAPKLASCKLAPFSLNQ